MDVTRHDPHSTLRQLVDKASGALTKRRLGSVSRRNFLHVGALAGAGVASSGAMAPAHTSQPDSSQGSEYAPDTFNEVTIAQLQAAMAVAPHERGRADALLPRAHPGARRDADRASIR